MPQLDTTRLRVGAIGFGDSSAALAVGLLIKVVGGGGATLDESRIGVVQTIGAVLIVAGIAGLFVFAIVLLAGWLEWLVERDVDQP